MTENYVRILAFLYTCTNLNSIMGLFRANNTVANFWMLFATLSAYVVVALEVGPEVDREALAHVACAQIFFCLKSFSGLGFAFALIASLSLASKLNHC